MAFNKAGHHGFSAQIGDLSLWKRPSQLLLFAHLNDAAPLHCHRSRPAALCIHGENDAVLIEFHVLSSILQNIVL